MATTDKWLKKIIKIRYLKPMFLIICVMFMCLILYHYAYSVSTTGAYTMKNDTIERQLMSKSLQNASLLGNTDLANIIDSPDLLNKLSKEILALDPQMAKNEVVLKSLEHIAVYTVLKDSLEQEENSHGNLKADTKTQPTQVPQLQADPIAKPQEDPEPAPQVQLSLKPGDKAKTKPQKEIPFTPRRKIDDKKHNCTEPQLAELERIYHVDEVKCDKLFSGDSDEIVRAVAFVEHTNRKMLSNEFYINSTANCAEFKTYRGYVTCPLTYEEEDFPIAYSILIFKDIEMVERLLRSIYRPQNYYCIHVDKKVDQSFFHAITEIVGCFENVFIPPERIDVKWGEHSALVPDLVCMEHLWKYKKWKYFINLTGQEFPLKTNWELVQILKAYNGANDIEGTVKRAIKRRWSSSPPHNLKPIKGSVHITANRDFVDYILHNQTARDLLEWVEHTKHSGETFFNTLNHNPQLGIPGTYKGEPETDDENSMVKPFFTRFKHWYKAPCAGQFVRGICILSTGDLPQLGSAKHLFANKFYLSEDPIVIGCLEERLINNTRDELSGAKLFNATFYGQLGFVKNQVTRSQQT